MTRVGVAYLQAGLDAERRRSSALQQGLVDLLAHLELPKFHGPENSWISTVDVARMVRAIEAAAQAVPVLRKIGERIMRFDAPGLHI